MGDRRLPPLPPPPRRRPPDPDPDSGLLPEMERLVDQIALRAAELECLQEQLHREEARRARRGRSPSRDRDRRGYYRQQPHQQHRSRTRSPPRARSPLRLWSGSAHPARIRAEERWMHTLLDVAQQAAAAQEAAQASRAHPPVPAQTRQPALLRPAPRPSAEPAQGRQAVHLRPRPSGVPPRTGPVGVLPRPAARAVPFCGTVARQLAPATCPMGVSTQEKPCVPSAWLTNQRIQQGATACPLVGGV